MNIILSNTNGKPLYEQIISQIKGLILNGTLKDGDPLPSMRFLAKELRISVITTKRAYEELERVGLIETVTGKGSFVAAKNKETIRDEHRRRSEELLLQAIHAAKESGISLKELSEMLSTLYSK
ncbi:GntR family transcriptional regulator [Sinanaerobacter sp. ZZT-01]|uniref:GntR family transcriptional regulator n=1 Tax=Sinanaerobacter sp. ZZT-01 TaxID=3111540 RepID=UPI002D76C317|nr:GntR family transcriptional regulator [Sinanaerobacter sp. ZZT-01]WRR92804.1 GntR family transcriptional regulator [Sinanaerobacter sp. ZZT-01]